MNIGREELAQMFDVALLDPSTTAAQIEALCAFAREGGFGHVCVNPSYVKLAVEALRGTGVRVGTVIGFPFGALPPEDKAFEAKRAVEDGASELDMVMNVGAFLGRDFALVEEDIRAVVEAAPEAIVKVIIGTPYLNDEQIIQACQIAERAGVAFVKPLTGFGPNLVVKTHEIQLMRQAVGSEIGVKAAGRVDTYEKAMTMIVAGATRIGLLAQQATNILTGWEESQKT